MTGQKELYDIFELIYPVGIIIELATSANPKDLFGIGEWEQIKDRFILAAGNSYTAGSTGGASTHVHSTGNHTLTVNEIPSHMHTYVDAPHLFAERDNSSNNIICPNDNVSANAMSYNTGYTGGGVAHNHGNTGSTSNMPPYYVAYLWRRVS